MTTVCVIGLGYIGTPTAVVLAGAGFNVIGVDTNHAVVESLQQGRLHIKEAGLQELLAGAIQEGQISFSSKPKQADYFVITVPTPITEDKQPDMHYVESAVDAITPYLKQGDCLILESTSPVGTMSEIANRIRQSRPDLSVPVENQSANYDIALAYCPERILPGKMLHELIHNDRVVGGLTSECSDKALALYQAFVKGECIVSKARTASLCKLAENAYRDVNIAFANELSMICEEQGVNVNELIELANRHPRVNILQPGVGVGGHCIAVDPWFIVNSSPRFSKLIKTAREVNDYKPHFVVDKIEQQLKSVSSPRILCLGLSYKPNIDDLRESPAVEVVKLLAKNTNYRITVCEPYIDKLPKEISNYKNCNLYEMRNIGLQGFDYIVELVDHDLFDELDAVKIQREKVI